MIEGRTIDKMWNRRLKVEFGIKGDPSIKSIENISIDFNIEKNSEPETTNPATITMYNLNKESRDILSHTKKCGISLYVGYGDDIVLLYSGDVIKSGSQKDSTTWKTEIEGGEGYNDFVYSTVNQKFKKGTAVSTVVNSLLSAFKNLKKGIVEPLPNAVLKGAYTVSGSAKHYLIQFLSKYDYTFQINNNTYNIFKGDRQLVKEKAVLITKDTGLISSPEEVSIQSRKDKKENSIVRKENPENFSPPINGVSFRCLLNPAIQPFSIVRLESRLIEGYFSVRKVTFEGSNVSSNWYANVEAVRLV